MSFDARTTGREARARHGRGSIPGLVALLLALLAALGAAGAYAHRLGDSYLYLQVYEETVTGRFEIALTDLNPALGLAGTDGEITAENLDRRIDFLRGYYLERVIIADARGPLSIDFRTDEPPGIVAGFVQLPFDLGGLEAVPESLTFDYSVLFDEDPDHRGFVLVEHNWATGTFANENRIALAFSPTSRRHELDLTSSGRLQGFLALARLGAEHMLLGVDHLMFLLALLLPVALGRAQRRWQPHERFAPTWRNAATIFTALAAAHLAALGLAALDLVRLPEALVETLIALSVAIAAIHLLLPVLTRRVWWVLFGLGLFHGFGFAAALLGLGAVEEHLGLSVLSFGLGIAAAQLLVLLLLVPILFLVRRLGVYVKAALPAAAVAMLLVAGVWTVERAFGVDVPMRELLPEAVQRVIP